MIKFVQGIRAVLEKDGVFHLNEIGFFSYNTEKRLQFKSTTTTNFLEESFGLPDLYFKPIERRETEKAMEQLSSPTPRGPIKKEEQVEKQEDIQKVLVYNLASNFDGGNVSITFSCERS